MCADGDATLSAMNFAMNIVQGKDIMVVCAQLIVLAYTAGATAETKHFRKRHGRQHRPAVIKRLFTEMADDNRTIKKPTLTCVGRWRLNLRCRTKLYDHLH